MGVPNPKLRASGPSPVEAQAPVAFTVEDDRVSSILLGRVLKHGGFEFQQFGNGDDMLEALDQCVPDVICLDLGLPGRSGIEILEVLRADQPLLPVVILTGSTEVDDVVTAMQIGAYDYLAKPLDTKKLLTTLGNAIELGRTKRALERTESMMVENAKASSLRVLAAGIAHEVKNPLAIILHSLEYLSESEMAEDETSARVLKCSQTAVLRADSIVRGLIDLSSGGKLTLDTGDLNHVIDQTLLLLRFELDQGKVRILKQFDPTLSALPIDERQISQVLLNLIMNAVHAMPDGGTVTITTFEAEVSERTTETLWPGDRVAVIEIRDSGSGLSDDAIAHLFDPFFTTKAPGEGTGLGLPVSRKIIEQHQGDLQLRNGAQGGVVATIRLKLGDDQ